MRRIYKRIIVSMMVAGMLFLAGCLFGPGEVPGGGTLTFVADDLVGPPSLGDGGFKVTFNCAGGNGEYVIAFGDGATGVPASPISHTYTKVGSYTATCTSGTETASLIVTVLNSPCGTLYEPYIVSPVPDCEDGGWEPPWHPCVDCGDCDDDPDDGPYEECDLWLCEMAILDGRYYTEGTGAEKEFYGQEICCGYDHTYYWEITLTSVCAALDMPLEVRGEGPTVAWYIGNENPPLHPDYPVLTEEGSFKPLGWCDPPAPPDFEGLPYGPKVALAYITLTVVDQFGSWQSVTVESWICTCEGCDASPCPGVPCDPCD